MAEIAAAVIGGAMQMSAAGNAADAQASAAQAGMNANKYATDESLKFQREALAQQREMYDQAINFGTPYRNAGNLALNQYMELLTGYKSPEITAPQYNWDAYASAMERYNGQPQSISKKQWQALTPDQQKQYQAGQKGMYTSVKGDEPKINDFLIDPTNPYNMSAYQNAVDEYQKSLIASTPTGKSKTTQISERDYLKLTPDQQKNYTKSGKKYTLNPAAGAKAPSLADFKNAGYDPNFGTAKQGELIPNDELQKERLAALTQSPGYQFQMDQGIGALDRSASARSGVLSGAASKALTRFGQGLAGTTYNSFMDRLAGVAGAGQQASMAGSGAALTAGAQGASILSGMGNTAMQGGENMASLLSQRGAAQASGYLGQGTAMQGALAGLKNINFGFGNSGGYTGGSNGAPSSYYPNSNIWVDWN
jgi:hypothetical protein